MKVHLVHIYIVKINVNLQYCGAFVLDSHLELTNCCGKAYTWQPNMMRLGFLRRRSWVAPLKEKSTGMLMAL
jgi:hypothetical protein